MTVRLNITPAPPARTEPTRRLADLRTEEGLRPDSAVLIADGRVLASPMRMPAGAWALLVVAADRSADTGEVVLFAGHWCEHDYPAAGCDGDLILHLAPPAPPGDDTDAVQVRLAVADRDRWMPAGTWPRLGRDWPGVVAPAAAAVMGTSIAAAEASPPAPGTSPPVGAAGNRSVRRVSLSHLLAAGLVDAGDELVYRRPGLGVHRTGHVTEHGMVCLDDGRVFANPSAAITALGSPHQNGWHFWCRVRDGRSLWELRAEYKSTLDGRNATG